MENKDSLKTNKVIYYINEIAKEFLVGTSITLNTLFVLKINNQNNVMVTFIWLLMMSYMFDSIVLKNKIGSNKDKKERIISLTLRLFFILISIIVTNSLKLF